MLVGKIEVSMKDLPAVKNLVDEAELAVQILGSEENSPAQEAVKEGLASALDHLRDPED